MEYAREGSLRQNLNNNFNKLTWSKKLYSLSRIADGLNHIAKTGFF